MNVKHLLLSFLVGALVAGGITYLVVRDAGDAAPAAASPSAEAADPSSGPAGPEAGPAGTAAANDRFTALETENAALEVEAARLEARVEALTPKPFDPSAFRFAMPEKAPAFDQANWPELSEHVVSLAAILDGLRDQLASGQEPTGKQVADIVKHNTPLATFAVAFGGDLEDDTPNGAFTHPAVIANLIRAALMAAEDPLTRDQEIAIQVLGDAWVGESQRALSNLPPGAPELAKTVADVDAKLRFLASVKGVLTESQRNVVFHPATEGRLKLDLLSPALVYVLTQGVPATDRPDMESKLLTQLLDLAGIEMEDLSKVAWVGKQWVDEIPGVLTALSPRDADLIFPHVDVVQARARAQVGAIERILAMGGLSDEDAANLRGVTMLLYPFVLDHGE